MHYEEAQAEIESLKIFKGYAERRASDYKTMRDKYLNAKSEAYKEFAERVKKEQYLSIVDMVVSVTVINNLLKELVGDSDDS